MAPWVKWACKGLMGSLGIDLIGVKLSNLDIYLLTNWLLTSTWWSYQYEWNNSWCIKNSWWSVFDGPQCSLKCNIKSIPKMWGRHYGVEVITPSGTRACLEFVRNHTKKYSSTNKTPFHHNTIYYFLINWRKL